MKKVVVLIFIVLLFTACAGKEDVKPAQQAEALKIEDYFPIEKDVRYAYEGKGNEYAWYEVYSEFTAKDKIQQRIENGGTVSARVFEIRDGKLTRLLSRGEIYYRENLLDQRDDEEEVLLMEPLKKGTTWTLQDGRERTIVNTAAEVITPLGTYSAIEVVTEGANDKTTDYYAKDIGLVKSVYQAGDFEISSALKLLYKDTPRQQEIRFYFPDINQNKIDSIDVKVSFRTNEPANEILQEVYKGKFSDRLGIVFSEDMKINSLELDPQGIVRIDFNNALINKMNEETENETMILQCIANTFGTYFGVDQVLLTVEGKPYLSDRIKMEEGQTISVNQR